MAALRVPACAGLVQVEEGQRLASLAAQVPPHQAIVEIGTHTGLSTCWMAAGSVSGLGAHITAVDPWGDPRPETLDDPFELTTGNRVYQRFMENLTDEGHWGSVTPLRTTSMVAAQVWVQPVGLLFIDAVHTFDAVRTDYLHWQRFVPVGGWLALHDYTTDVDHAYYGVALAVQEVIEPTENWAEPVITEYLWTAQRIRS